MRLRREERGASAVEFALIASLLFMILFGTIQFGILFNRYQGLQAAAREGARLGSLQDTTVEAIEDRVADSVSIVSAVDEVPCDQTTWNSTPTFSGAGKWCVRVFRRQEPGMTPDPHGSADGTPCNASQEGSSKSVIAQIWYRARLDIPLWASPQMTLSGTGEFKCE